MEKALDKECCFDKDKIDWIECVAFKHLWNGFPIQTVNKGVSSSSSISLGKWRSDSVMDKSKTFCSWFPLK